MPALSPFLSRALAVLLLLAIVVAVKFVAVDPVIDAHRALADRIERADRLLASYRERHAGLVARAANARGDGGAKADRIAFLAGSNPTLVGAALQSRIQSLIEAAGGQLISTQMLEGTSENGLSRVTLRTRMQASVAGLQRVFHALESQTPVLFLDNVSIHPARRFRRSRSRRPAAARTEESTGRLAVDYDVYGFVRTGGAS